MTLSLIEVDDFGEYFTVHQSALEIGVILRKNKKFTKYEKIIEDHPTWDLDDFKKQYPEYFI